MAVASKISDSKVKLIDVLEAEMPKTKEAAAILKALSIQGTVLVAVESYNVDLYKSFRNIAGVRILPIAEINAYEVLKPKQILMTKTAEIPKIPRTAQSRRLCGCFYCCWEYLYSPWNLL
jgi:large subunit ribosomal protein L4